MIKTTHLTNVSAPELSRLLYNERITYSVLEKILNCRCTDIFTDYESFIICYSNAPFPIWVWQKSIQSTDTVKAIAQILNSHFPTSKGYKYNMPYELFGKLCDADISFRNNEISMGLISYELIDLIKPSKMADGGMELANILDIEPLTNMLLDMSYEAEGISYSREDKRKRVLEMIESESLYIWRTADGKIAATTSIGKNGDYCRIGSVYTCHDMRRRGYAISLVYSVCTLIKQMKLRPILYTDESYTASNACYKKIGFCEVGRLCNVSVGKDSV